MKLIKSLIALALLAVPLSLRASALPQGKAQTFAINTGLIFELYNVAQQNSGQVTQWPASMNSAVVQATVQNIGSAAGQLCFQLVVQETNSSCSGGNIVYSPIIRTKASIAAGETKALTASDFELDSNSTGNGVLCSAFQNELESQFKNIDPSKLNDVVQQFLKRRFKICLVPVQCGGTAGTPAVDPNSACTDFTLFSGNPGSKAQVAVLIFPHNNAVADCNLNFLWTPAQYPGLSNSDINYILELRDDVDGNLIESVTITGGQTYYQWSARNRVLTPGQKYYWRLVSVNAKTGQPFGGTDNRGWNITKWFICGTQSTTCHYSLDDLDKFVQMNGDAAVKQGLTGFKIANITEGQLDDPVICRLLAGTLKFTKISVTKK